MGSTGVDWFYAEFTRDPRLFVQQVTYEQGYLLLPCLNPDKPSDPDKPFSSERP